MPFVKLDCGILDSTLWLEREAREVFITALLMAEPLELTEETPEIATASLEQTGWSVPRGWYGFVPAASVGILHRAGVPSEQGIAALARLAEPEQLSRSADFAGRRMVRINGGFIILNYIKYRERDYTAGERQKRYRKRLASQRNESNVTRNITQAEGEAEGEAEKEIPRIQEQASLKDRGSTTRASKSKQPSAPTARSKRPIFTGQRLVVFEWQLDDLSRLLGSHTNDFDLHEWFFTLDARAAKSGEVIPQRDGGKWLQEQTLQEAQRRGLPISSAMSAKTIATLDGLNRFANRSTK